MPYITREDGEHFVIPSYRDVLTAKSKNLLKRDILLLSQSYGEYITLQKKGPTQWEVAFSSETGHLLGESVWHYFRRPIDMIYCEAIPNTTEAILVIVKAGSVYLDGSFPLDSIPEELIIFLTQKNFFEIYTYGDVPISETTQEGKFSFEPSSVKSFTQLPEPAFPKVPLLRMYQLQLVDQVLRAHGIGVFPTRQLLLAAIIIIGIWFGYDHFIRRGVQVIEIVTPETNPYQGYNLALSSPAPDAQIKQVLAATRLMLSMPGWHANALSYGNGSLSVRVQSNGGTVESLKTWANVNFAGLDLRQDGIYLILNFTNPNRSQPQQIYPVKDIIGQLIDRLSKVYPGNHIQINQIKNDGVYSTTNFDITLTNISPVQLALISESLQGLPLVLKQMTIMQTNSTISGTINMDALGS